MNKILRYLYLFIFALTLLSTSYHSQAQTDVLGYPSIEEHIQKFEVVIKVSQTGTIVVKEDIYYDFGPNERHGIFRKIPYYKTNNEGKKFKMNIYDISVPSDKFSVSDESGYKVIKIGDPNRTVTEQKRYTIEYKVDGAVTYFEDFDELYWNFTGNEWQIPIRSVLATVQLPPIDESKFTDLKTEDFVTTCYTGGGGSTQSDCTVINFADWDVPDFRFTSNTALGIYEGFTGAVSFPKGLVAVLEPKPDYNFLILIAIYIVFALLLPFAVPTYIFYKYISDYLNTKKKMRITSAWFQAPKHVSGQSFTPVELSILLSKDSNFKSFTGMLIDLAMRHYFKIDATTPKDIKLVKQKDFDIDMNLKDYERDFLRKIFKGKSESMRIKDLERSDTYTSIKQSIDKSIWTDFIKFGYFYEKPNSKPWLFVLTVLGIMVSMPLILIMPYPLIALFLINKTIKRTDLGIEKYSEGMSLKNFLVSQTEQLNFMADKQMFFEKLLPYATALGVEKVWADKFKDLNLTPSDWYVGDRSSTYTFVRSLGVMSRSFKYSSSHTSSSGFSSGSRGGGGRSGGGGGGGGGGSW